MCINMFVCGDEPNMIKRCIILQSFSAILCDFDELFRAVRRKCVDDRKNSKRVYIRYAVTSLCAAFLC